MVFFGYFVLCMLSDIMNQFTRGKEQLVDMAIAGILNSIMTIVLNILFLLYLHWGLEGYFWQVIFRLQQVLFFND